MFNFLNLKPLAGQKLSAEIDRLSEKHYYLKPEILMESAAVLSAEYIQRYFTAQIQNGPVLILCGPGHNGADGLAMARHLHARGATVHVFTDHKNISGLGETQKKRLAAQKIPVYSLKDFNKIQKYIKLSSLVIDALFGVGLARDLTGLYLKCVQLINKAGKSAAALDVPSGLDADTGEGRGAVVRADITLTYSAAKPGFYLQKGPAHTGHIQVVSIGVPYVLKTLDGRLNKTVHKGLKQPFMGLMTKKWVAEHWPKRKPSNHKAHQGHLLVLAGSKGQFGAGELCASAGYRMGCGYVTLAEGQSPWPKGQSPELKGTSPRLKVQSPGLKEQSPRHEGHSHSLPDVLTADFDDSNLFSKKTAAALGPGLEVGENTKNLILRLKKTKLPVVIDASAFTVCVKEKLYPLPSNWIATPHSGELSRLFGLKGSEVDQNKCLYAVKAAKKLGCAVLLKGFHSVLAFLAEAALNQKTSSSYAVLINPTGNAALAKAGTGDVLTGFIGALTARGVNSVEAAALSAFVHGEIADEWLRDGRSADSLMAQDLKDLLPQTLANLNL